MTRKIKQAKVLAVLSLLLSGTSLCYAETGVVTGSQNYATDQTVDVTPDGLDTIHGILVETNEIVEADAGTTITINMGSTVGNGTDPKPAGVSVNGADAVFEVDKLIITDADENATDIEDGSLGISVSAGGVARVGDNSSIEVAQEAVIASGADSRVEIGDNATLISSNVKTNYSGAVKAMDDGEIAIGDGATIRNVGGDHRENAFSVVAGDRDGGTAGIVRIGENARIESVINGTSTYNQAYGLLATNSGSKITVGDGAQIRATGDAVATAVQASAGAEIELGENQTIFATGNEAVHGIHAAGEGSRITVGSGSTISIEGPGGYGDTNAAIVATNGGTVTLLGDQVIRVDPSRTPYAIHLFMGSLARPTLVTGNGKLVITGGIYTGSYGNKVDLTFQNQSVFTGNTVTNNAGEINLTMHVGSQWRMTGNSQVSNLTLLGGPVYFETDLSSGQYGTLRVRNITSDPGLSSTFFMRTDIVNEIGDRLLVTGTSFGRHMIYVANQGSQATTGNERFTLVETAGGDATFAAADLIELGGYVYDIQRAENQNNWELYPRSGGESGGNNESSTASGAKNIYLGSYLLNYAENQTLLKRLGDLRDGAESSGVWARVYGGKFDKGGNRSGSGFNMDYHGIQAGFDKKINSKSQKRTEYVGGFAGYSKGSLDYSRGSGDTELKYLGAYWTHLQSNGFYLDTVLKYGWMDSDFKVRDTHGDWVKGKGLDTNTWSGSLEVGKKFYRNSAEKSGWYVEPQAQLTLSHQKGDEITASNGLRVKVNSLNSIQGRLGLRAGYEIKGGKNPVNLYAKVSQIKEFDGEMEYYLNGSKEKTSYKDNWWVYGVGMNAQLGTRHQVYFDVEKTSGDKFDQDWGVSGGYRYSW